MDINSSPELTQTVEDFIALGISDEMTYSNFSVLAKCIDESSILYAQDNVIYDYLEELKSSCVTIELTDEDAIRYRYNPKRLSYQIYGSTELYFIILALNGMCSFKDFNKKHIKVLYKRDLQSLLTQIYNAEAEFLSKNRNHIKKQETDSEY